MNSPLALDSLRVLLADQPVLHGGRRATFLHMSGGVAIIRYWGDSHAVAVPPETLALRPTRPAAGSRRMAASDEPTMRESNETG
jgi:hypothetical protein